MIIFFCPKTLGRVQVAPGNLWASLCRRFEDWYDTIRHDTRRLWRLAVLSWVLCNMSPFTMTEWHDIRHVFVFFLHSSYFFIPGMIRRRCHHECCMILIPWRVLGVGSIFFIRQCCQACKKFALSLFWQLFQVVLLAIPRKKGVDWLWRVFQNWSHSWFCDYFCDCAGLGDIPQQIDQSSSDLAKGGWRSGEELHTERGPEKLTGHCEGWYWSILDIVKDRPLWRWYQSKVYWLWLIDQWVQWSQSISAACYELFI